MRFTIIVPTYNEAENIENCIATIDTVLKTTPYKNDYKILITDGKSPDGTAGIVTQLKNKYPQVELIEEKDKQGLGKAYLDAMDFAFEKLGSDSVITFDADLSHDAKILPEIFKRLSEGSDLVVGSRYKKGGGIPDNWGIHRKFLSRSANLFVRTLYFKSGITDFTSGYKGMSKRLYYDIRTKIGIHKGYTFAISTHLESIRSGFKSTEIPYKFVDRTKGKSKMGSEYIFNGLKFVISNFIKDTLSGRFAKVFISGGVGAVSQLIVYGLLLYPIIEGQNIFNLPRYSYIGEIRYSPIFFVSQLFSIEVGVISTFMVNNNWSFRDKKLSGLRLIRAFIKNQFVVMGAILIQLLVGQILKGIFGAGLFRQYSYQIIGILVGLLWNFYFYKKIIWKVSK